MTTFEAHSRPTFRERVFALAGHSTWREPTGAGTSHLRSIPADHMVAAALSFGRAHLPNGRPDMRDIGPDMAMDLATGRAGNYARVCEALGRALSGDRSVLVRRHRPYIAIIAMASYNAVMGRVMPTKPAEVDADDWNDLVAAGAYVLETLAEDALALAARRARRAA